ncbi:MAG TPA: glutamate racemase [Clostridia bacterium]|nr:glutamate racemase [Clostridia bacterium]
MSTSTSNSSSATNSAVSELRSIDRHLIDRRHRIAVFDSGVGGLTVLRAIAAIIPNADYLYFGDTARLPYGSKSRETVARYAIGAARFLEQQKPDILVIGCNTACALALYDVRSAVDIPVIGVIDPGAERAAEVSRSREAVVIGTEATISTHAYQRALAKRGFATHEKACPLFVALVEEGWTDHPVTEHVARIYLAEALGSASAHTDVLVLGCTHYPLIRSLLRRVVPANIEIVDSAEATAQAVADELDALDGVGQAPRSAPDSPDGTEPPSPAAPTFHFYVTDSAEKFSRMAPLFLGHPIENVEHVDLGG